MDYNQLLRDISDLMDRKPGGRCVFKGDGRESPECAEQCADLYRKDTLSVQRDTAVFPLVH